MADTSGMDLPVGANSRETWPESAAHYLPVGTEVLDFAAGRGSATVTPPGLALVAAAIASTAVAFATAQVWFLPFLIFGALCGALADSVIRPRRIVAVAHRGVALLRRSPITGKIDGLVALSGIRVVEALLVGNGNDLSFEDEVVTLSDEEAQRLVPYALKVARLVAKALDNPGSPVLSFLDEESSTPTEHGLDPAATPDDACQRPLLTDQSLGALPPVYLDNRF